MKTSRRDFLKQSSLATAGTMLVPSFIKAGGPFLSSSVSAKKLVIIQLSGGNDGLNTVVPFKNDLYYKYRPLLAQKESDLLKLSDEVGLHQSLTGLRHLFDDGLISIMNRVGYPNPNRSHFRSMDIWQTASDSDQYLSEGWIGRYLDHQCDGCEKPWHGIEIDDSLSLAMKGSSVSGLALTSADKFRQELQKLSPPMVQGNESLDYLRKIYVETRASADYIYEKSKIYKSKKEYPSNGFAKSLKLISELILSGTETKVFYTSLSGFDTHSNQAGRQSRLLQVYGDALKTFVLDLKENGALDDTLIMTFSEFGRRVKENASRGTDHGTANNVFLAGGKLKSQGLYNELDDLSTLEEDDLRHAVDFRTIYATILEKWLGADSSMILGRRFDTHLFI